MTESVVHQSQFAHTSAARAELMAWSDGNAVPLARVEFVPSVVDTDLSLYVWLFYATDLDISRLERDGTTQRLQAEFLAILGAGGYPAEWLSEVVFCVDSAENVERNYDGSYFYRLRG